VGLASSGHGHHGSADIGWFVLLAVVFAVLVAFGIVRVLRAPPPEGLE
jgi:hypothetical protein